MFAREPDALAGAPQLERGRELVPVGVARRGKERGLGEPLAQSIFGA